MDEPRIVETWIDPVMGFRVTLYGIVGALVESADGRDLWSVSDGSLTRARARVEAQLRSFASDVQQPHLMTLELGARPGPIASMAVDRGGRWAAVGGEGGDGWLVTSTLSLPVPVQAGRDPQVHWLGDEVVIVAGDRASTVTAVDGAGRVRPVLTADRWVEASCTTRSTVVLAFDAGWRSPMLAVDRDGRLVFDFDRDMTRLEGRVATILAGRTPDQAEWLACVDGERVFWKVDGGPGEGQILDLGARTAERVPIPDMFEQWPIALASDGTIVTQVVPAEVWTVRGAGPIERWQVPDLARADPIGGGRMLLWDGETGHAVVFDPALAASGSGL